MECLRVCVTRFGFFFFKQKTAYEMRISDWSSDVCSSDLGPMTTAYFAQLLAREYGAERLKSLDITFTAPVYPEEPLTLTCEIAAFDDVIHLELKAEKADGTQTAKGTAAIRHEANAK